MMLAAAKKKKQMQTSSLVFCGGVALASHVLVRPVSQSNYSASRLKFDRSLVDAASNGNPVASGLAQCPWMGG